MFEFPAAFNRKPGFTQDTDRMTGIPKAFIFCVETDLGYEIIWKRVKERIGEG